MKPNSAKEKACKIYFPYIHLILNLGKGVMFSKHIEQYMTYFNSYSKTRVWRDLRDMQNAEIIEIKKYHNSNFIKLRKYPLRYIAQLNSPFEVIQNRDLGSIQFTELLLRKSLFINQYIISKMLNNTMTLEDFIEHIQEKTTLLSKAKDNIHIFEQYPIKTKALQEEIDNLKKLKQLQTFNLKTCSSNNFPKRSEFNINNMQSRNIFISELSEKHIVITLFDLYNNYTPQKISDDIRAVYSYLFSILTDSKDISFLQDTIVFNIVVAKESYKKRVLESKPIIQKSLNPIISPNVFIGITSLNIDKNCFSNVKLLL